MKQTDNDRLALTVGNPQPEPIKLLKRISSTTHNEVDIHFSKSNTNQSAENAVDCREEADMSSQITILYSRLSRDDENQGTSNSILNQKHFLQEYAEKNGFTPFVHIEDDGFSGTNWNRPGWNELIDKVEAKEVATVISKDGSRMARDYIRMGMYREMFHDRGVRLICVNDGYDSANGEDDFMPFKDIFAEWHARDTSRKIRAIFNSRTADGKHVSGAIPYGYIHDPNDRQNWLLDEDAAKVIRHIFHLVIDGNGVYQIAKILEQEKVLIPTAHWEMKGIIQNVKHTYQDPYMWRGNVVSTILKREEYMGKKILRKTYSDSYKSKKRKEAQKDDWLVFEGAIPQIVDEETWHTAQRLRKTVRRPTKSGKPPNRLTGLLYCADCGSKMTYEQSEDGQWGKKAKNDFVCRKYRNRAKDCTMHFIRVPVVDELILDTIKTVSRYVLTNEDEFVGKVREASMIHQESAVMESKKDLSKSKRRYDDLDCLIKKLYESYATGKIPEKHFEKLLAGYDGEQTSLEAKIAQQQAEVDNFNANSVRADKFIEIVKRYTSFDELTTPMLNEFIEKVIVHEGDRSTGKRIQKVAIHLNFIGHFIPETSVEENPKTPGEIDSEKLEALRKYELKRAKDRERLRNWRKRKREERIEETKTCKVAI